MITTILKNVVDIASPHTNVLCLEQVYRNVKSSPTFKAVIIAQIFYLAEQCPNWNCSNLQSRTGRDSTL